MYRLIPCRHGVCASPSPGVTRTFRENKSTTGIEGVILLPGGIERDVLAQDESIIFPGPISLDEDDIKNLDCLNPDNFSFTHYGPDSQDKTTNQDFALSGYFTGRSDRIARFSILADGISNGFAFPQRGAQLSCFAAYHCLKALYEQFAGADTSLNEKNIKLFRDSLASRINRFFELDRAHLLHLFEADHREPPGIDSKVWQKYFKEKPEKWYGNTLLISFLSSFGGFVVYAGDGGIILLKGERSPKEIIRSSESLAVDRFAMMGVKPAAFLAALIGYDRGDGFVEIISVTDGIDRTWQTNEMDLAGAFSAEASLAHLMDQIAHLQDRIPGSIDVDNYSIGRVFLPLSAMPHGRMSGSAKHTQAVEISPGFTPKDADVTGPQSPVETPRTDTPPALKKKIRPAQFLLGLTLGLVLGHGLTSGLAKMQRPDALPEVTSTENTAEAEGPGQAQTTPVATPAETEKHKQAQPEQQAAGELPTAEAEGPGQAQTTPVATPAEAEEHKQAQPEKPQHKQQAASERSEELGGVEAQAQAPRTPPAKSISATMQADQTQADPAGETTE